jgi:hypothetical protein
MVGVCKVALQKPVEFISARAHEDESGDGDKW